VSSKSRSENTTPYEFDMRASLYRKFGPPEVLEIGEVPEPAASAGKARVRVRAAALNPKDVLVRKGKMTWLTGKKMPRIPGYDFAGELLDDAGGIPAGTNVWGMVGSHDGGACAEVVAVPFEELGRMPDNLTMEEAAGIPLAALTALQALRDELGANPGDRVLMNGASGGVGTLAVQIGAAMGLEVVGVCSGRNRALVEELGASEVIDYTAEDPRDRRGFAHVFDIYGNISWRDGKKMLEPGGLFCSTVPTPTTIARAALGKLGLHRMRFVVVKSRRADLDELAEMVAESKLKPVVDRVLPLAEAVEAHRYIETRRARGKVVLAIGG
jgi:NADPH:quinone reductase-like Zn-dependent oxidoreductase